MRPRGSLGGCCGLRSPKGTKPTTLAPPGECGLAGGLTSVVAALRPANHGTHPRACNRSIAIFNLLIMH